MERAGPETHTAYTTVHDAIDARLRAVLPKLQASLDHEWSEDTARATLLTASEVGDVATTLNLVTQLGDQTAELDPTTQEAMASALLNIQTPESLGTLNMLLRNEQLRASEYLIAGTPMLEQVMRECAKRDWVTENWLAEFALTEHHAYELFDAYTDALPDTTPFQKRHKQDAQQTQYHYLALTATDPALIIEAGPQALPCIKNAALANRLVETYVAALDQDQQTGSFKQLMRFGIAALVRGDVRVDVLHQYVQSGMRTFALAEAAGNDIEAHLLYNQWELLRRYRSGEAVGDLVGDIDTRTHKRLCQPGNEISKASVMQERSETVLSLVHAALRSGKIDDASALAASLGGNEYTAAWHAILRELTPDEITQFAAQEHDPWDTQLHNLRQMGRYLLSNEVDKAASFADSQARYLVAQYLWPGRPHADTVPAEHVHAITEMLLITYPSAAQNVMRGVQNYFRTHKGSGQHHNALTDTYSRMLIEMEDEREVRAELEHIDTLSDEPEIYVDSLVYLKSQVRRPRQQLAA